MSVLERFLCLPKIWNNTRPKTQSSYIFEESELIPDGNLNFLLFLKINIELLNRMTEFKENLLFG